MAEFSFLANLLEYDVDFSFLPKGHHFDEVANAMEAAGLMERAETKAEEEEDDESDRSESDTSQKTEEHTACASDTGEERRCERGSQDHFVHRCGELTSR